MSVIAVAQSVLERARCELLEMTTQSTRTGTPMHISMVTWRLAVGRREIKFMDLRTSEEAWREEVGKLDGHGHSARGLCTRNRNIGLVTRAGYRAHGDVRDWRLTGAHDGAMSGRSLRLRASSRRADGITDQRVVIDLRGGGISPATTGQAGGDKCSQATRPLVSCLSTS